MEEINVLLVGSGGTGKTTFWNALTTLQVDTNVPYVPTPSRLESPAVHVPTNRGKILMRVWDTNGQEKALTEPTGYPAETNPFKGMDGVFVLADMNVASSVRSLSNTASMALKNGKGNNFVCMSYSGERNAELTKEGKELFPAVLIVNKAEGENILHPKVQYVSIKKPYKLKLHHRYMSLYDSKAYTGGYCGERDENGRYQPIDPRKSHYRGS